MNIRVNNVIFIEICTLVQVSEMKTDVVEGFSKEDVNIIEF